MMKPLFQTPDFGVFFDDHYYEPKYTVAARRTDFAGTTYWEEIASVGKSERDARDEVLWQLCEYVTRRDKQLVAEIEAHAATVEKLKRALNTLDLARGSLGIDQTVTVEAIDECLEENKALFYDELKIGGGH
jgi:hypothetical protein